MTRAIIFLSLASVLGCACRPATPKKATDTPSTTPDEEAEAATAVARSEVVDPATPLAREPHRFSMTEAVLDPRGEVALTLDAQGDVRLWTQLRTEDQSDPIIVPAHEPTWMTIGQAGDSGYVVAFIDTAGATSVARIEVHGDEVKHRPLFDLPVTDRMFEIHILDGGERILALGVDHRVRLYDQTGAIISQIDEPSFIPWQLRVAHHEGEDPSVVAVLAHPVSVQRLELKDDKLRVNGERRVVAIDQSPNRNDLALTPDGRAVTALRRTKRRRAFWTLEVIELDSGERRKLAAELDEVPRPRVHLVDAERILFESASGKGFWYEHASAVEFGPEEDDKERPFATPTSVVELPGARVADGTLHVRMHTSTVRGLRIVPHLRDLVADPIDDDHHVLRRSRRLVPSAVALNGDGSKVAWGSRHGLVVEDVATGSTTHIADASKPKLIEFLGERILVVEADGAVTIRDVGGEVLAKADVPVTDLTHVTFHRTGDEAGVVGFRSYKKRDPIRTIGVTGGSLGEAELIPAKEATGWDDLGPPSYTPPKRFKGDFKLVPGYGDLERLDPSPSGDLVAAMQSNATVEFHTHFLTSVVSIFDANTGDRLWSRPTQGPAAWSGTGDRVALRSERGGMVVDVRTGEPVLWRGHLGVLTTRKADSAR